MCCVLLAQAAASAKFRSLVTGVDSTDESMTRMVLSSPSASVMTRVLEFVYTGRCSNVQPSELIDLVLASEQVPSSATASRVGFAALTTLDFC